MSSLTNKRGGNKKRSNKSKQNQNKNQNKNQNNQQGGTYGNSYSVAASNGGVPPMTNYRLQNGGALVETAAPFSATIPVVPVVGGNVMLKGGNVPGIVSVPVAGGNVPVPVPSVVSVPVPVAGGNVMLKGGNVLNDLAVPAVLLYANQTFGKKKNYTGKNRKFRNNKNKSRRYRRSK